MHSPKLTGPKERNGAGAAWWNGVSAAMLENITGKIHPGALRYYKEANMTVPASASKRNFPLSGLPSSKAVFGCPSLDPLGVGPCQSQTCEAFLT